MLKIQEVPLKALKIAAKMEVVAETVKVLKVMTRVGSCT